MPKQKSEALNSGDIKRVKLASPVAPPAATTPAAPTKKRQLTLKQTIGAPPTIKHAQSKIPLKKTGSTEKPVGFVQCDDRPATPPAAGAGAAANTISPASHIRSVAGCASPAHAEVDNIASPHTLRKPSHSKPLFRSSKVQISRHARLSLFGTSTKEQYTPSLGSEIKWSAEKFTKFQRQKKLTQTASTTTQPLVITGDTIMASEGKKRITKQDDVMGLTAITYMQQHQILYNKVINWAWGHRKPFALDPIDPPTKDNLNAVSPAANQLEARITDGLKKAMKSSPKSVTLGQWELEITTHYVKVTADQGQTAYLPYASHRQDYQYTYVYPNGERSEPLVFFINPLEPNSISYENTTIIFKNLFYAVMRKNLGIIRQLKLDLNAAVDRSGAMAAELGIEPLDNSDEPLAQALADEVEDSPVADAIAAEAMVVTADTISDRTIPRTQEFPYFEKTVSPNMINPHKRRFISEEEQDETEEEKIPTARETAATEQDEQENLLSLHTGAMVPMHMDSIDSDGEFNIAALLTPSESGKPAHFSLLPQAATQPVNQRTQGSPTQNVMPSPQRVRITSGAEHLALPQSLISSPLRNMDNAKEDGDSTQHETTAVIPPPQRRHSLFNTKAALFPPTDEDRDNDQENTDLPYGTPVLFQH